MSNSDAFGVLTLFIMFLLFASMFVLAWIFGDDPEKRDARENRYGPR